MPTLTDQEIQALRDALDAAYQSWAACDGVIQRHGLVRPFGRIRLAEAQHIQKLWRLLLHQALPVPPNPWQGRPGADELSLAEACLAGSRRERSRQSLLTQLLQEVSSPSLRRLLEAGHQLSVQRQLPAYERCGHCGNTAAGGCPGGVLRPATAPPRRCTAHRHQDWLWSH